MNILAIDPGVTGGYCYNVKHALHIHKFVDMCQVRERLGGVDIDLVYIEKVHSSSQMGVKSAFTFGQNYGAWNQWIEDCLIQDRVYVPPQVWQRSYPELTGIKDTARKKLLKKIADEKAKITGFDFKLTLATCDAFLIWIYGQEIDGH